MLALKPTDPLNSTRVHQGRASGARKSVAAYHEEQLGRLVDYPVSEIDNYRAGELDTFDVDRMIFQYSRAATELWKFCNLTTVEIAAHAIAEHPPTDRRERGAPRQR